MPVAIVTGASVGIGREFARICARKGYDVVLISRSRPHLESLATEIRRIGNRSVVVIAKDLSDPAAPGEIFSEVGALNLEPEVLINNAGFGLVGRFWELSETEQMQMVQLNVTALTHLTRLFLPQFITRRRGQILMAFLTRFAPIQFTASMARRFQETS